MANEQLGFREPARKKITECKDAGDQVGASQQEDNYFTEGTSVLLKCTYGRKSFKNCSRGTSISTIHSNKIQSE